MARSGDELRIRAAGADLYGMLDVDETSAGTVVFAHGSGSSRHSPRNQMVAGHLREHGLGTLLFDLLTPEEERIDMRTAELRFDIEFLATRLVAVTDWLMQQDGVPNKIGYFGSSTGAAAALIAASRTTRPIAAIVSRGGRPDLADAVLASIDSPTLLIVGGNDPQVLQLNEYALERLNCEKRLIVIDGATHLFSEPGTLEEVARQARRWFVEHFQS